MTKKKKLTDGNVDIPKEYLPVVDDFIEWLAMCSYETEQITEIRTYLVEFINYLVKKETKLAKITEEFVHNYYLEALKTSGLPEIPPKYKRTMAFITSRQETLHAFSRFITGVGKSGFHDENV